MTNTRIRPADQSDVPELLRLIRELATFEKEPDAVRATEADLSAALFPSEAHPTAFAHVAEVDGQIVGMALWYLTFSTWTGTNGIWLEDLYVQASQRGAGLGTALLLELAAICRERGYARLEWSVLTWNQPAIDFYRGIGAEPLADWQIYRLSGTALDNAAPRR